MFLGENPLGGQKCYRTERKGTTEEQCDDMTGEERQCTNHSDTTWAPDVPGIIRVGMTRASPALLQATLGQVPQSSAHAVLLRAGSTEFPRHPSVLS